MTAEISILNQNGVVLAADSAVTLSSSGRTKVFNSAKKIFTLGSQHSIAIMIYGSASFMEVPWEIIIKEFNRKIDKEPLKEFGEYIDEFFNFIKSAEYLTKETTTMNYVKIFCYNLIETIFKLSQSNIDEIIRQGMEVSDEILVDIVSSIIEQQMDGLQKQSAVILDIDKGEFYNKFEHVIEEALNYISTVPMVTQKINHLIKEFVYFTIIRSIDVISDSGVVITGYGNNDIFPKLKAYRFQAMINDELKHYETDNVEISHNHQEGDITTVIPFAQSEMVTTVIHGLDPSLQTFLINTLDREIDDKDKLNKIFSQLSTFQDNNFISPVLDIVNLQPLEEMASTAAMFVNLTSFKRKIVNTPETVGGPVDVLAISKSDGPVWISRKHYFDIENNMEYKIRKEGLS